MTAWRLKAACFDHPDLAPDAWDTPAESQWSRPENLRALRVCLGCPVVVECLQDVMAIDRGRTTTPVRDNTIRGGLIPTQRTALARGQRPRWVAGLGRLQARVINAWARRAA